MSVRPLRVALVADLLSEQWPSMDLTADMLAAEVAAIGTHMNVQVAMIRPAFRRRRGALGRYVNRFLDYPWWLRRLRTTADVFHVIDHSYAHLVHVLPADRTVVTCHDIDAFLTLLDRSASPSRLPTMVTRAILSGMRRAAHVTCDTNATRDQVLRFGLMSPERLSVVHMGVHAAFRPLPEVQADAALNALLGTKQSVELLHVGSCIPRKRIDVLLEVFAGLARTIPGIRLLKAGGQLTADQRAFAATLGVEQQIAQLPRLDAATLAALYRRADVTLLPSDREGFGLPLLESLACGTAVVASDIAALREIGGHVTAYVPVGAVPEWCDQVRAALAIEQSTAQPQRRVQRVTHAAAFGWDACARSMVMTYTRLAHTAASTAASQTNGARS